jgi:long-chain acyl-CoA synthetase
MAAIHNFGEVIGRDLPGDAAWMIEIAPDGRERTITRDEFHASADALARGLIARGLERGQAVGIYAANSAEYLIAFTGIMRAGMVAVPVNTKLPRETVAHIVADSDLKLLLVDGERASSESGPPRIRLDDAAAWNDLLDPGPHRSPEMRDEEIAYILYTSGSTGRPKGVPLTHGGYLWVAELLVRTGPPLEGKRALIAAPLFHMNGLLQSLFTSVAGGTVVLLCRFTARDYLEATARHRCQLITSVPTMLALAIRETETLARLDLSHVEIVVTGSAPSTEALFDHVAAIFPNARVMNGWGTTESSPAAFGPHPEGKPRPKLSIGYPLPEAEWKLVDGPNADEGVLWVRNKAVMPGYLNLPAETAKRIRDGWYDTGDVMRRDAEGFFYFVGRADDMFVCGGENIYPGEVEKLIERHPAVAQAAVVPAPDDIKGQIPVAFVVQRPGAAATTDEIKDFALERAPAYMHPRFVEFVPELPLAGTNKVDRKALIDRAAAEFRR